MARSGSLTSPSTTPSAGQTVSSSSASGRPRVAASTRSTRLALQRRRRKRRQRHPLAAPQRAIPQRLAHLRRRPKVMMRPHHSTEPRLLLGQHRTERHLRKLHPVPAPMQPLFKDLYRNSSRKSTPKRIRLEIQEPQSEQKSALPMFPFPDSVTDCPDYGIARQQVKSLYETSIGCTKRGCALVTPSLNRKRIRL